MAIENSNPVVKGASFNFSVSLMGYGTGRILTAPTIAAGDFTIVVDGVSFGNMDTIPELLPAAGKDVMVYVSDAEADGHVIKVTWIDQTSPPEWEDGWQEFLTIAP